MRKHGKLAFNMALLGLAAITSFTISSFLHAFPQQEIEGIWQGTLKVSGVELRIVFKISKTPEGKLTATLNSPDQGAKDIPASEVTFENGDLKIEVKSIFGVYTGKLDADNATITGEWKQGEKISFRSKCRLNCFVGNGKISKSPSSDFSFGFGCKLYTIASTSARSDWLPYSKESKKNKSHHGRRRKKGSP